MLATKDLDRNKENNVNTGNDPAEIRTRHLTTKGPGKCHENSINI